MTIEGTPKEIADLILALQGQLNIEVDGNEICRIIHKSIDDISPKGT